MAVDVIPKRLQRVWDKSNICGSVLASLCLQILLIFLAPSRKRARGYFITIILWSAYLLADFVAAYSIGLISNNQGDKCDKSNVNDALSVFWAPFLFLHLGGPDSITAFALEDNELWIRHLFGLIAELIMVAYVFTQAIPFPFWLPTVLVLLAGVIKYAERTRALYLASLDNFTKDSVKLQGPVISRVSKKISFWREAQTTSMERTLKEIDIVQAGFDFYKVFRRAIVDQMLYYLERHGSRDFFFKLQALDAFRVMEVELNFMYDALFTKLATVHGSYLWYIVRFICAALITASFILFKSHHKPHIHPIDITITYSLLIGAIILEIVSLIKLVFSDWTVARLKLRKAVIPIYKIHKFISFRGRWSNSMAQYNLISLCLKRRYKLLDKVTMFFGLKEIFEELMYTKFIPVEDDLKLFISDEIKEKAFSDVDIRSGMEIYSSRGNRAVKKYTDSLDILSTVDEKETKFTDSVLIWHIATDFLYYKDYRPLLRKRKFLSTDPEEETHNSSDVDHKKLCKILSDYMLYLIVLQPSLISVIPDTSRISFPDTCEAVKAIFGSQGMNKREACMKLLTEADKTKYVFNEACLLERNLESLNDIKKWEMMSEVWLEFLCYGASHCKGRVHAQQLSKGGELVTFVWLLMYHFGLCNDL